jgi:AraC family carnitine catabolism transcriptional activator
MRRLAFLVLPEFSHLGLAAATEPLFIANWLAQRPVFEWLVVSPDGAPVRASNGMIVPVGGDLGAAADCPTVFVLASFDPRQAARDRLVVRWLRRIARFGTEIGGIENGSLVLAEAGLLDGLDAAVHWDNLIGFREHYPAVRAAARLYARSGRLITCAGASAILDMMVAWIGWQGEPILAGEVADHLLLERPRPGGTEQLLPASPPAPADPAVARAQAVMLAHIDEPIACAEVARRVGLSLRQIERRFKRELGRSVARQYRLLRMAKAHQLLQQTELSVTEIALSCGFPSLEYFARLYRLTFDRPPSADRRQSTDSPVLRLGRDPAGG